MDNKEVKETYIEKEKREAEELLEALKKIPPEDKGRVLGMVEGYALAAAEKTG